MSKCNSCGKEYRGAKVTVKVLGKILYRFCNLNCLRTKMCNIRFDDPSLDGLQTTLE